jgi:hypothetical protein
MKAAGEEEHLAPGKLATQEDSLVPLDPRRVKAWDLAVWNAARLGDLVRERSEA